MVVTRITTATVKALREETGFSMMDCKRALQEADGDYREAKRRLRKPPDKPDEPAPEPIA